MPNDVADPQLARVPPRGLREAEAVDLDSERRPRHGVESTD
jgi:hypothetical protein